MTSPVFHPTAYLFPSLTEPTQVTVSDTFTNLKKLKNNEPLAGASHLITYSSPDCTQRQWTTGTAASALAHLKVTHLTVHVCSSKTVFACTQWMVK